MRGHFTALGWPKRPYTRVQAQRKAAQYKQVAYECNPVRAMAPGESAEVVA